MVVREVSCGTLALASTCTHTQLNLSLPPACTCTLCDRAKHMQNGQNTNLHANKSQLVSCELYVFICFKRTYPPLFVAELLSVARKQQRSCGSPHVWTCTPKVVSLPSIADPAGDKSNQVRTKAGTSATLRYMIHSDSAPSVAREAIQQGCQQGCCCYQILVPGS